MVFVLDQNKNEFSMDKLEIIKKEFEEKFTMGSYERYIWEFIEEKFKETLSGDLNNAESKESSGPL